MNMFVACLVAAALAIEGSDVGLVVAAAFLCAAPGAAASWFAALLVVLAPGAGALGLRPPSPNFWTAAGCPRALGVAVVVEGPMFRACVEEASLVAFSRIARCLSSSLAKMGNKSSGMGLLS